jgi:hypothetical protein
VNRRRIIATRVLLLALIVLTLNVGPGQAQEPEEEGLGSQKVSAMSSISPVINYQGKLFEDGGPAEGARSMTFRLWDDASGGTAVWTEGPRSVTLWNGIFTTVLGETVALDVNAFDQALWLEIEVEGTTLPRQRLMGAPYALSLVPEADITGSIGSGQSLLFVNNGGSGYGLLGHSQSGHGVYARSGGSGPDAAALYAWAMTADGVAIRAENSSSSTADATILVTNKGTGDLIQGFDGNVGDGDEFRVGNDGSIQTQADSYLFVPGNTFVRNTDTDNIHWDSEANGSVLIWSTGGTTADTYAVYLPISLPGVLYGQSVEVKSMTIYYRCQSSTGGFITSSYLYVQTDVANGATLVSDEINRDDTGSSSYTLTPTGNNILSDAQGILTLLLYLELDPGTSTSNYVQLGGVRVQLGHHE